MSSLSSSQRKHLRGRAHSLKPMVQVGRGGLTEGVVAQIDAALDAHELIKVRLADTRDEKQALCANLEDRLGCQLAGLVGHVAILYRRQPERERRRITLPG